MRDAAALILLALTSTLLGLALMLSGAVQVSEAIPIADNTWYLTDRGVPAPLYIMIDGHTAGRENVIELRQGSAYAWYSDRNYPYPGGQSMDGEWILYLMVKKNELPRDTPVTFVVGVSQSIGGEIKSYGEEVDKLQKQSSMVKKNDEYKALLKEISNAKAKISDLETRELELMDQMDEIRKNDQFDFF